MFQLTVSDDKGIQDKSNIVVTVLNNRHNDVVLFEDKGWNLYHLERYNEAIQYFDNALNISRNNATLLDDIGFVLMDTGNYTGAITLKRL